MDPKPQTFRSKKLREAAKGQDCVSCNKNDGTTVAAHISLPYAGFQGGMGSKTHDFMCAHLCHQCHTYYDGIGRNEHGTRSFLVLVTLRRLFEQGVIEVK